MPRFKDAAAFDIITLKQQIFQVKSRTHD